MDPDLAALLRNPALTPQEVMRLLRSRKNATYDAIARGEIPSFKFGASYRVPTEWMRKQLQLPATEAA
jgi:excisionase family DNA binding protein